ncbi:cysteine-rich receptor-like protein kinase 26 isoform X2 [Ziziphus jujuba]|uniref:Cysteine-rich receptor-like protein kinase 26 isoform X2 n=1 Tax=Ziziphus jujuba TaxID=326968 RepID=A0A6P3Z031_ZIZJJ|nr:cysteine-rich receptor-like protein kinase 26 isoform X2 [Ziziphus jujuba]
MDCSSKLFCFIFPIIILMPLLFTANFAQLDSCTERAEYCWNCTSEDGNLTDASTIYKQNLNSLLTSFISETNNNYGFYNSSLGQNPDKVNAIALCRGDVVPNECRDCINETTTRLLTNCPNRKEAIIWGERCLVRYSNSSIFYMKKEAPFRLLPSPNPSAASAEAYKKTLDPLLENLIRKASSGDSLRKFAYGNTKVPDAEDIYALVQCTPDLSEQDCNDCLVNSTLQIPGCCAGKSGGRVLKPSCTLRYEYGAFYNVSAYGGLPPPEGKSDTKRTVVIIVVVLTAVIIIVLGICIFFKRRKAKKKLQTPEDIDGLECVQFDFGAIKAATDDFSDANKLGEGGFGAVYKGRLSNGQYIAVKRLSKTSQQGDLEFKNEVKLVAKLQHRNLVRLFGFSLDERESERLLVYEFVPNASLNQFIFDPIKRRDLDWSKRYKIIGGIARGLLYLHEDSRLKIIHRDLKLSNILLDEEMNPKIADFGMARLSKVDQAQERTSRIVGTYGYMAPEYAMHGQFSIKSDVYSFGVLLLEIISGQKNTSLDEEDNVEDLLNHAWMNWKEGTTLNIVDPTLRDGSASEIMRCIHIALLCVQENHVDRLTMNSVVAMLTSHSLTLSPPSHPPLFIHGSSKYDMPPASNRNFKLHQSDMMKSNMMSNSSNSAKEATSSSQSSQYLGPNINESNNN